MINVTIVNNTANNGANIYTSKDDVNIPTVNLINSKFGHSPFALVAPAQAQYMVSKLALVVVQLIAILTMDYLTQSAAII